MASSVEYSKSGGRKQQKHGVNTETTRAQRGEGTLSGGSLVVVVVVGLH